jgi:hypothetical protein
LSAVAAGVLTVAAVFLPSGSLEGPPYSLSDYLYVYASGLASLLLLGGIRGLRARHAGVPGWPGRRSGFALASCGALVTGVLGPLPLTIEGIAGRALPAAAVLGFFSALGLLALELGMLLLGLATLRARALPMPWRALPLVIFLSGLPLAVLILLFFGGRIPTTSLAWGAPELLNGTGWALLGYALWSGARPGSRATGPSRTTAAEGED